MVALCYAAARTGSQFNFVAQNKSENLLKTPSQFVRYKAFEQGKWNSKMLQGTAEPEQYMCAREYIYYALALFSPTHSLPVPAVYRQ